MRHLPTLILAFILLAAPGRSAPNAPPSEAEIATKLKEVTREKQRLEAELSAAMARPSGGIDAVVRGMMRKDASGYHILTRMGGGAELRVWVPTSVRTNETVFDALIDKDVVANGRLLQRIVIQQDGPVALPDPKAAHPANVPPHGLYLRDATIRDAKQPAEVPPTILPPSVPVLPKTP